ncbi:hypothetical protein CTAM01_14275 [Colletotrichum tamarilloi]|uniref:Uncharacterized protein n=1 Tax=Colletotrichum tamarilloi TaxID=1209934 RepID=A0ABQ9QPT0_9PEZI|nr:uncharacterized protein CTAM01_14275 [Colletotrichum tamarilloi]KAK1480713.1 hypothetical protein CTAM01_14275 [Colletotrichum tamarilloi]
MALALRHASLLKPEIRLAQAVSEFEASLDSPQKASFRNERSTACTKSPTEGDVMRFTAEIDRQARQKRLSSRCFGPRLTNLLQSVQQFAALGDVVVGGSQNLVACGVWAAVRMTLHRVQSFARKSAFGQLTTSLNDSDIKNFQSDLVLWSTAIKEEVDLLLNKHHENEAHLSAKARALATRWSASIAHRYDVEKKSKWLDSCSTYDFQTTWKQMQKIGSTSLLARSSE